LIDWNVKANEKDVLLKKETTDEANYGNLVRSVNV
jgi:hypothetical protein